jgi:hypothetical protein
MKLPPELEKLSQVKHAKVIGILLTIIFDILLVVAAVFIGGNGGYYMMMVGLVIITFVFPYLFGIRDGRTLAVIGVGVFLLVGSINGPLVVYNAFNTEQPEPTSSQVYANWFTKSYTEVEGGNYTTATAWYRLENGTQELYKGNPGQMYRFRVTIYSNDTEMPNMQMGYARGIWGVEGALAMTEMDPTDNNLLDGKEYYHELSIEESGIYSHWFAVVFTGVQMTSLNSSVALGPLVGSQTDNWGTYIPLGAVSMFCNIGLLFLIIVLLYWWLGTAKEKRKVWDQALREKEDGPDEETGGGPKPFTCDQCGAGVGADDNFCPKCGERFDGEIETVAKESTKEEEAGPEKAAAEEASE